MIHPFAEKWRASFRGVRRILSCSPAWMAMWAVVALCRGRGEPVAPLLTRMGMDPARALFAAVPLCQSGKSFSARQLGGLPELHARIATSGWRPMVFVRACSPSCLPALSRASVRDVRGSVDRSRSLLVYLTAFAMVTGGDDPHGRCGVGEEIWRHYRPIRLFRCPPSSRDLIGLRQL